MTRRIIPQVSYHAKAVPVLLQDHRGSNVYYVSLYIGDAAINQLREEKEFAEGQVNNNVIMFSFTMHMKLADTIHSSLNVSSCVIFLANSSSETITARKFLFLGN